MEKKNIIIAVLIFFFCPLYAQQAGFTYTQETKCVPSTVNFTNTSSGSPNSVLWDFGDSSNPSLVMNPEHPYENAGKFTVTLIAYYNGYSDTIQQIVEVYPLPAFDFVKSTDSVCPGSNITFTASVSYPTTSNAIRSYTWDFGDGGSDTVKNPTYTFVNVYNFPSDHQISLTITDTNGCIYKLNKPNYIFIHPNPVPDFTAQQYYCYPVDSPAVVHFTNTTSATTNNSYQWTFSDGQQSTLENPVIAFQKQGNYSIYLFVRSSVGCTGSVSKTNYIQVGTFNIRDTVSDTIVCFVPGEVTFHGLNGMNTDYFWDFGDGTIDSSVSRPITHIYNAAGTYQVRVMARHFNKTCLDYDTMTIHVYEHTYAQLYVPDWDTILCNPEDSVIFIDSTFYTSSDDWGYGSIIWDFGDGGYGSGSEVFHTYSGKYGVTSNYTISLSIVTPYGCKLDTVWQYIEFFPIQLDPWVDTDEGCIPLNVTAYQHLYMYASSSPIQTHIWLWDFPNNLNDTINTGATPYGQHVYTERGYYDCYLMVINRHGCIDTFHVEIIRTGKVPAAGFTIETKDREDCYYNYKMEPFIAYPFDSLDVGGNLIGKVPYGDLEWLVTSETQCLMPFWTPDPSDTAKVFPFGLGYCSVILAPSDNGCYGHFTVIDSAFYVCPPLAYAKADLPSQHPLDSTPPFLACANDSIQFQGRPCLGTAWKWHFGDAAALGNQSTDTNCNPRFTYSPLNAFVEANKSKGVYVSFTVLNDDSLGVNNPTFNRCGYCEDTSMFKIIISSLDLNFSTSEKDICQGNTIKFYDSSTSNVGLISKYFALNPIHTTNAEYTVDTIYPRIGKGESFEAFTRGYPLYFEEANSYTINLLYEDSNYCDYVYLAYDTVNIRPGTIISWQSSLDGILFQDKKDTLCINSHDSLYLKDVSYTPLGFDSMEIINRRWIIHEDTFYTANPIFFDTIPGLYDVSLRIVNEHGCVSEKTIKDYVMLNKITALFAPYLPSYCNKMEVKFANHSYVDDYEFNKHTTLMCEWDFGDGSPPYTTTGVKDVSHTYNLSYLPDTINVTLTVSALDYNCSETYSTSVIITGVIAGFSTDNQIFPCPGNGRGVQFVNATIGEPIGYYWNFGDSLSGIANESSLREPAHEYKRSGKYSVLLIVKSQDNCMDTLFIPEYIIIDGPTGNFSYTPLDGCVEHTVAFIPTVNNTDTLIVNADRASPIISEGIHLYDTLKHTYTAPGSYVPYFYLIKWIDNNGTPERCIIEWPGEDTIHVISIFPNFEADSLYCPENLIRFKSTSTSVPARISLDSVSWDFGNGKTMTAIDGITQYDTGGFYVVNMIVYAKSCQKQITKEIEILHFPSPYLSPDSVDACSEAEVSFVADSIDELSQERITQYRWMFQDGETFIGNPANKIITSDGYLSYQLVLTFTPEHCYKIYYDSIFVLLHGNPSANFEVNPQPVGYGEEILFTDKSTSTSGQLIDWYWNFGDNTESDLQNPIHAYDISGEVLVVLKIKDEFGCMDSMKMNVLILESLNFPNIFTPTGSNDNKYFFCPMENKGYFKKFQMNIYNKWGTLVWSNACEGSNCPDYSDKFWWDGTNKSGKIVSDGVYYWVVQAFPASETTPFILNGSVTVLNSK